MKILYQKHHGLPGVSMSVSKNGEDGNKGNNVYFGFINDFFDTIDVDVDNIVRYSTEILKDADGYFSVPLPVANMYIKVPTWETVESYNKDVSSGMNRDWVYTYYKGVGVSTGSVTAAENRSQIIDIKPQSQTRNDSQNDFVIEKDDAMYSFSVENEAYDDIKYSQFNSSSSNETPISTLKHQYDNDIYSESVTDYVKHSRFHFETLKVADKLSESIKSGDIIYFYTNAEKFASDHIIEYMIVITKQLERCSLSDLIENANMSEPLTFKYIDNTLIKSDNYIITNNKVTSVYYNDSNDNETNTIQNLVNFIDSTSDNILNLAQYSDTSQQTINMIDLESEKCSFKIYSKLYTDNETLHSSISTKKDEKSIPLKISNMYALKNNIGNIETVECVVPKDIKFDDELNIYTLNSSDFNFEEEYFIVDPTLISDNIHAIGIIDVIYHDDKYYDSVHTIYKTLNTFKYQLKKDRKKKTDHTLILYVCDNNQTKRFSKKTYAKYNTESNMYEISWLSVDSKVIDESSKTEFTSFGISPNAITRETFTISIPTTSSNVKMYVNSTEIDNFTKQYSNDWSTVAFTSKQTITETKKDVYTFSFSCNDNIPQMSNSETEHNTNISDYISNSDSNDSINGCVIFNNILNNNAPETEDREDVITLKYDYLGESYKTYYKIVQPGYKETRKIPKIDVKISNTLEELENSNKSENGVLCNQYQFFIDVNVSDFDITSWGTFVDESKITLNFDINSIDTDYDYITKFGIQNAQKMYTMHAYTVDEDDFKNNYLYIKTMPVNPDINDVHNASANELSSYTSSKITITDNLTSTQAGLDPDGNYIKLTKTQFDNNSQYQKTYYGVNCDTKIEVRGLTFSDVKKSIRFRVLVEMGNPIFSKFFFRYYVSNAYVEYDGKKFDIGSANLVRLNQTGRYQSYDYMYSTEKLTAFVCPVSLIAAKCSNNEKIPNNQEITVSLDKYVPNIATNSYTDNQMVMNDAVIDWFNFKLKKRYLQDNIKNMHVYPIHISDIYNKISAENVFVSKSHNNAEDAYQSIKTSKNDDSYLMVLFNSQILLPIRVKDLRVISYNSKTLTAQRYQQLTQRTPVFTRQELTYSLRDSELYNSIQSWNKQLKYVSYGANLNVGHNNTSGNAYMYINDTVTVQQTNKVYSISKTKELNEISFFSDEYSKSIQQPFKTSQLLPLQRMWYRNLVWSISWKYPKYYTVDTNHTTKIDAYNIIDCGRYKESSGGLNIPYNITYSIFPRCAYDDENDNSIIFMLRCPSVVKENQYEFNHDDVKISVLESEYNASMRAFGSTGLNII